jgi:hypothetical protein
MGRMPESGLADTFNASAWAQDRAVVNPLDLALRSSPLLSRQEAGCSHCSRPSLVVATGQRWYNASPFSHQGTVPSPSPVYYSLFLSRSDWLGL